MTGLRERSIRIVFVSGFVTVVIVSAITFVLYLAQLRWSADQIASTLEKSAPAQIQEMAASFLLPEQSAGRKPLLDKYQTAENLEVASVLTPEMPTPPEFDGCNRGDRITRCQSKNANLVAIVVPIIASDLQFGHLLKAKTNDENGIWFFRYAIAAVLAVMLVVATVVWLLMRLHAQVAKSLVQLEEWTSEVALGSNQELNAPNFQFREINVLGRNFKNLFDRSADLQKQAIGAEIARQVAHDIRSPVHSLSLLIGSLRNLDLSHETRAAIQNSANRINEIAESLLAKHRSNNSSHNDVTDTSATTEIASALSLIVSEKRVQLNVKPGVRFEVDIPKGAVSRVHVNAVELKRAFSNLLNNAIQAVDQAGEIAVALTESPTEVIIEIRDTGCGIPPQILDRLGERGLTYGQVSGSGLGVFHACKTIRETGGDIEFVSTEGVGTTVTIRLPTKNAKPTFALPLTLESELQVIIVDDDLTVHQFLEEKFKLESENLKRRFTLLHFYSFDEALMWAKLANLNTERLFIVDYELSNDGPNGLDLIELLKDILGIKEQAILVTSRADDSTVKNRARSLGVDVLRKDLADTLFQPNGRLAQLA